MVMQFVVVEEADGMEETGQVFGPYDSYRDAEDAKEYASALSEESRFVVRSITLDIAAWWNEREELSRD